jgi:hypothetical protein
VSYAQNSAKAKKFINEVITDKNIIYLDSAGREATAFMYEALKKNKVFYNYRNDSVDYEDNIGVKRRILKPSETPIFAKQEPVMKGRITEIVADSLVLTDAEIVYANNEIEKMRNHIWKRNLFPNSKLLFADSLVALQHRRDNWIEEFRKRWSVQSKEKSQKEFSEANKKSFKYYRLSTPVFLRDNTYCLFYYSCCYFPAVGWDDTRSGNFIAYKKINGKWVLWGYIDVWMT